MIFAFTLFTALPAKAAFPTYDSDEGVVVMETQSGDVLDSQNADQKYYPASTTKLMTALVMMDYVADSLDKTVTVGDEVSQFGYESSTAGLEVGLDHGAGLEHGAADVLAVEAERGPRRQRRGERVAVERRAG